MRLFPDGNHIKLLRRSHEFRDQDFKGIPVVVGREEWANVRFADEAEEFFPAAGNDEAHELGVLGVDLVSMDRSLFPLLTFYFHRSGDGMYSLQEAH
jgi:hypothetical protein